MDFFDKSYQRSWVLAPKISKFVGAEAPISPIQTRTLKVHQYPFGLIVYLNRTWTGIHVTCGIISAIAMLLWFLIPESPRWLAQNGYENEAIEGNCALEPKNTGTLTK